MTTGTQTQLQVSLIKPRQTSSSNSQEPVAFGANTNELRIRLAEWLRGNTFEASTQSLQVESWVNGRWVNLGEPCRSVAEVEAIFKKIDEDPSLATFE